jgi:AraC-like DNA-binding protein
MEPKCHVVYRLLNRIPYLSSLQWRNLKMERACYYLSRHDNKVSQVAKILGFKDTGHFSEQFAKIKKVRPGKYYSNDGTHTLNSSTFGLRLPADE